MRGRFAGNVDERATAGPHLRGLRIATSLPVDTRAERRDAEYPLRSCGDHGAGLFAILTDNRPLSRNACCKFEHRADANGVATNLQLLTARMVVRASADLREW